MSASFYELLKYAKTGIASTDMTAYDKMRAVSMGGGAIKTLTGVPPLTFKANGTPLISLSMLGNGQQSGTPTPDAPIMPEFVGVRTAQLFDKTATDTTNGYVFNGYLNSGGTVGSSTNHIISEYTYIGDDTHLTISNVTTQTAVYCSFYTAEKVYISSFRYNTIPYTVEIPSNAKYIRFTVAKPRIDEFISTYGQTAPASYIPYGFQTPITNAGQTVPVYLGQVQTVRKIKKLVFDGTENFTLASADANRTVCQIPLRGCKGNYGFCTHVVWKSSYASAEYDRVVWTTTSGGTLFVSLSNDYLESQTAAAFKSYLAQQYANGTPVTVWYVLATPETGIVNEPLCKIGDYADELHSTDAGVTIPTEKGDNTLTVDTTLSPSEMTITYRK